MASYTSKSVLLKDKTGNYLSPVTDIASLFYDFNFNGDNEIVRRFAIKDNFIVNTSFKNVNTNIYKSNSGEDPLYWVRLQGSNNLLYPMHLDNTSIYVSDVSIVPINNGKSKLRSFDVKRYDLSSIFLLYTPIKYANYYIYELKTYIDEVSTNIHNTLQNYETHDKSIYVNKSYVMLTTDSSIKNAIDNSTLIPGCIYALNYNSDTIKYIIGIANSSSSFSYKALGLIKQNTSNPPFNIDTSLFNMFDIRFKVDANDGHVIVTYMKDHLNNEAYFDFLNKLYIHPNTYSNHNIYNNVFLSTCTDVSIAGTFINNHVKHKVKINLGGHIINNIINSSLDTPNYRSEIYNSLIDSEISNNITKGCYIQSSTICKNVSIYLRGYNKLTLTNVTICDNSSININLNRTFNNVYIGKNCNINIDKNISNVHIDDNVILTSVNSSTYYTNYKIFARN